MQPSHRLIFANQLRGLAAMLVVASHLIGLFWAEPDRISHTMALPPVDGPRSVLFTLVGQPWFNPGPFGVAVFFLISGLVIPISLARHDVIGFLSARAMRIYPTAIAALLIDIAIVRLNVVHWQLPMPWDWRAIVTNALLISDLSGMPTIDLVNWTLSIELGFYLIMALFARPILRGQLWPLFVVGALSVLGNLDYAAGYCRTTLCHPLRVIFYDSSYVVFMMIGVLFNYYLRGKIGIGRALFSGATLLTLFVAGALMGPLADMFHIIVTYYLSALALFTAAYAARRYAFPLKPVDALAAVSYPLYLVHPVVGLTAMRWAMLEFGLPYHPALAVGFGAALIVATALHFGVERWSVAWGQRRTIRPAQTLLDAATATPSGAPPPRSYPPQARSS